MIDQGKPIRVFYANLLQHGVTLHVVEGALQVRGNTRSLSPTYREEIVKRKDHLIDLLSVQPPEELESYFGRLLTLSELKEALWTAERLQVKVRATPVNSGWLLEMEG
jgi:hypothetical protein